MTQDLDRSAGGLRRAILNLEAKRGKKWQAWEEVANQILAQIERARNASGRFGGDRNWEQVQLVEECLTEVETIILLSNPGQEWILAPEPAMRRLRAAVWSLDERWAKNLAQEIQLWLRLYP
jgi:hypothetical protein